MIFSLGITENAKRDFDEIIRNSAGAERPSLRRAYQDLIKEASVDGASKGIVAPFNPNWRRLEDENGWLAVVYDAARAADDRYVEILHFVRLSHDDQD